MTRVIQVSSRERSGGAAIAAYRLNEGLNQAGIHSSMLIAPHAPAPVLADTQKAFPSSRLSQRIPRFLKNRKLNAARKARDLNLPPETEMISDAFATCGDAILDYVDEADIVHFHWVSDLLDYATVIPELIARGKKIVWTLHDMNAFTGGCHFNGSCEGYLSQCGKCPQIGSHLESDETRHTWAVKQQVFATHIQDIHFVTPSHWLKHELLRSSLGQGAHCEVIPNGINQEVFRPRDKSFARDFFDLPTDKHIILFVAENLLNKRKGFECLLQAAKQYTAMNPDIMLVALGSDDHSTDGIDIHYTGRINQEREMACLYATADCFIIPSLQDNLPNTVVEALSCGIPVIGADAGGIPEMIEDDQTGLLFQVNNPQSLTAQLSKFFSTDTPRDALSPNARRFATERYSIQGQTQAYTALYQKILK